MCNTKIDLHKITNTYKDGLDKDLTVFNKLGYMIVPIQI